MPKLTVTYDGEKQKQIEVLPTATVLLNGSEAALEDIRPADVAQIEVDQKGRATKIEATRLYVGIVFNAEGANEIVLTTDFTDRAKFPMAEKCRYCSTASRPSFPICSTAAIRRSCRRIKTAKG